MKNKRMDITDGYELDKKIYTLYNRELRSSGGRLDVAKSKLYKVIDGELTQKQADVISMYYFDNLKQEDIARKLNRSQATVSRTLKRAKSNLARVLKYLI